MVRWNYLNWEEMVDTAEKFFREKISSDKKIVLVHHGDADGVTSAVYIADVLKKITGREIEHRIWVSTKSYRLKQEKLIIDNIAPDVLIITDLDIAKEKELLRHWSDTIDDVFIYDHHNILESYKESIPRSIEYLNARMLNIEGIWHPASFFGYELHKRFFDQKNYDWIVAIGLRGDHALFSDEYVALVNNLENDYPELLENIEGKDYKNLLEKSVYYINAGFFYNPDLHEQTVFKVLWKAKELDDYSFIYSNKAESEALVRKRKELKTAIKTTYEKSKEKMELFDSSPLIIYRIDTPHYILGVIAGMIADDHPERIVLVLNKFQDEISGEIREGESANFNVVNILLDISKDFSYLSVGGHPRAAGCLFLVDKYKEFYDKFIRAVNENI